MARKALLLCLFAPACQSDTPEQRKAWEGAANAAYCGACHEQDQGIGPRLTPSVLTTRLTVGRLFAYNRDRMPYNAGQTLTDTRYWDIIAYLVARSRLADPDLLRGDRHGEVVLELPSD